MDSIKDFFSDKKDDISIPDINDDDIEKIDKNIPTTFKFIITIIILSCLIHNPFTYTIMGFLISRIPSAPFNMITVPRVSGRSSVLFLIHSILLGLIIYGLLYFSDKKSHWTSPCNVDKEE
jgi:hypothetical protein